MKRLSFLILATSLLPCAVHSQIFADFDVSHGDSPLGTFRVLLQHEKAPRTCANFIGLATGRRPWLTGDGAVRHNTPFYDGLRFHRLIHDFVIQAGSPNGTGTDGPGYTTMDEYHPDLRHSGRYILSMAKSSLPSSNGSQFFITLQGTAFLDDKHSVFGEVISGREIIDAFNNPANFPTGTNNQPVTPIVINSVMISGPDAGTFDINSPDLRLPEITTAVLTGTRNPAASTFVLNFDRTARTAYQIFGSTDLSTWSSVRHLVDTQSTVAGTFTLTGLTVPRYFSRVSSVSYATTPDAPPDLVASGKQLVLTHHNGHSMTLTFNGGTGGTWTDGTASGTLSSVQWTDYVPATGAFVDNLPFANELALGNLRVTFSPAAGPNSISLMNATVSFHTPTGGYLEETATTSPPNRLRYAFEWKP